MILPQIIFIIIAFSGAIFHVAYRRDADFLAASFFGLLLYFIPGFAGVVLEPYNPDTLPYIPIIAETYWVFSAILLANIIFSFIYRPPPDFVAKPLETSATFDILVSVATVVALALAIAEGGAALFDPDKNNVIANLGRFWVLFSALSMICAFVGIVGRRTVPLVCGLGAVAFLMFVGFRAEFAIVAVAVMVYYVSTLGKGKVFSPKFILPGMAIIFFVLLYKQIYIDIKFGNYDRIASRLVDYEIYLDSVGRSEPFVTQAILNTVLLYDYRIPFESLISVVGATVPFLTIFIDVDPRLVGFNFQEILFPSLDYGLASNIYANFYALFGFFGIFMWILIHNLLLVWMSKAIYTWQGYKRIPLMICGSLFSFYIIRSDLMYNITSVNRIVYTFIAIYLLYRIINMAIDGRPDRSRLRA